jgi:hypothetical protein
MVCREITPNMSFSEYYYFENPNGKVNAIKCWNLLKKLEKQDDSTKEFGIWETRQHNNDDYVCCWYVGFKKFNEEKVYLVLHFDIRSYDKKDGIRIYFRLDKYAPNLDSFSWALKDKWKMILNSDYNEEQLIEKLNEYLGNVRENWKDVEQTCKKRKPCTYQRKK